MEPDRRGKEVRRVDEYEFVVPQAGGPWSDIVREAIEACRLEAREPAGVRFRGSENVLLGTICRKASDSACRVEHGVEGS